MSVVDEIISFLKNLIPPSRLPSNINVLFPYKDDHIWEIVKQFYHKYYNDDQHRIIILGINPGRFGGGITGIPFTDPIRLEEKCGIVNPFEKRGEMSSKFIYEMIDAFGGTDLFYSQSFISSISPLGFVKDGKNLNYYDIPSWKDIFHSYSAEMIKKQFPFIRKDVAICIGQGANMKFLQSINEEHNFFEKIVALPHPRWVMQYRLKQKEKYIREYLDVLKN